MSAIDDYGDYNEIDFNLTSRCEILDFKQTRDEIVKVNNLTMERLSGLELRENNLPFSSTKIEKKGSTLPHIIVELLWPSKLGDRNYQDYKEFQQPYEQDKQRR
jgi:hypothetical protein